MAIRFDQFTPRSAMPQMAPTQTRPTMRGLLDALIGGGQGGELVSDDARKAAQRQGLLALGAQMLQAGGPSPTRTSLGQALGQGIMAGQGAQQQGLQQALQAQLMMSQIQRNKQTQQQKKFMNVAPGGTVFDPETGESVFTNRREQPAFPGL